MKRAIDRHEGILPDGLVFSTENSCHTHTFLGHYPVRYTRDELERRIDNCAQFLSLFDAENDSYIPAQFKKLVHYYAEMLHTKVEF